VGTTATFVHCNMWTRRQLCRIHIACRLDGGAEGKRLAYIPYGTNSNAWPLCAEGKLIYSLGIAAIWIWMWAAAHRDFIVRDAVMTPEGCWKVLEKTRLILCMPPGLSWVDRLIIYGAGHAAYLALPSQEELYPRLPPEGCCSRRVRNA
jgi:hypothetical protein